MAKNKSIFIVLILLMTFSVLIVIGERSIENIASSTSSNSWYFIAIGDSRQQHEPWDYDNMNYPHENSSNPTRAAIITSIVENNPNLEFIVHSGDLVNSGGEQDDWDRYFEDIENATKENVTFYYAIGNHERYTYALGPSNWGPPDEDFSTYLANVELPGNERYYSFDYMNQIHFVFINTEENWTGQFDITTDQYNWLINDLENNTLEFVVAVFHRPCYSVRDPGRVDDAQEVRSVLDPIFIDYGVDLVFSGHDHYYYRTVRNSITYVTTGGAGADLYTNGDTSEWQDSDVYFSEFHYCNVTVTENAGELNLGVEVFIFNETDKSITLGDSFNVTSSISSTSTSTDPITSNPTTSDPTTTTASMSISSSSIPSIPSTSEETTSFSFYLIFGIVFILIQRKRK